VPFPADWHRLARSSPRFHATDGLHWPDILSGLSATLKVRGLPDGGIVPKWGGHRGRPFFASLESTTPAASNAVKGIF
jgi:hypothetical protein